MMVKKILVVGVISITILALTAIPFMVTTDDSSIGISPLGLVRAQQVNDGRNNIDMETTYIVSGFDGVIVELTEVRTGEVVYLTDPAKHCTEGAFCHITDGTTCSWLRNLTTGDFCPTTGDFCNVTALDGCTEGIVCHWMTWAVDC